MPREFRRSAPVPAAALRSNSCCGIASKRGRRSGDVPPRRRRGHCGDGPRCARTVPRLSKFGDRKRAVPLLARTLGEGLAQRRRPGCCARSARPMLRGSAAGSDRPGDPRAAPTGGRKRPAGGEHLVATTVTEFALGTALREAACRLAGRGRAGRRRRNRHLAPDDLASVGGQVAPRIGHCVNQQQSSSVIACDTGLLKGRPVRAAIPDLQQDAVGSQPDGEPDHRQLAVIWAATVSRGLDGVGHKLGHQQGRGVCHALQLPLAQHVSQYTARPGHR